MNKDKRRLSLLLLAILCATAAISAHASAGSVTGYQKITWGISTGRYYVNGIHAFCAQYNKSWPTVGTAVNEIVPCTNDVLRKALYYGYNGPENTLGTDERAHVLTAIAVSDANIGEAATGASAKYDAFYWELVNNPSKYPSPPDNFKAYLAITASDAMQNLAFYEIEEVIEKVIEVHVIKYQSNTEYVIPGTVFEHTAPDGSRNLVTTDENGKIILKDLQFGEHTLWEIDVMDGYAIDEPIHKFTIDENTAENLTIRIYDNPAPYYLTVCKKDHYDNKLFGAEFTLYEEKECMTEVMRGVTDENGMLRFSGLKTEKRYYLKETKAPEGYEVMMEENGEQRVYEIYAMSTPVKDEFACYVDGEIYENVTGTKADREVKLDVTNDVGYVLPKTGSCATVLMNIAGTALCGMSLYLSKKEKKQTKGEKQL